MTKPTKWHVRPAKTQISLAIRPVWSESSLSAWRKLGSLATHWAQNEDSYQTGRMPRLIWVFAGRTCQFVGFVTRRLIYNWLFERDFFPKILRKSSTIAFIFKHEIVFNHFCSYKLQLDLACTSFSVQGPKLWNSLPADIRNSTSINRFKRELKRYLLYNN